MNPFPRFADVKRLLWSVLGADVDPRAIRPQARRVARPVELTGIRSILFGEKARPDTRPGRRKAARMRARGY